MDPNAAVAIIESDAPVARRIEAAEGLRDWLARGGLAPDHAVLCSVRALTAVIRGLRAEAKRTPTYLGSAS